MGCAQTAAVGDPMVVGLLLFLNSEVCQVADPSFTPSLKGLLLDGLAPRPRGKHGEVSFSGGSWTPDSRKHDTPELPVAPRPGEILLFASPRLPAQENLAFLMAISSQRRERAVQNLFNGNQKQNQDTKTQTFDDVAFKLYFECHLDGLSTPKVLGMCANMS